MNYQGRELALFSQATCWKSYLASVLTPWIQGRVLEVGAGAGGTTRHLVNGRVSAWTCLEPDSTLAGELRRTVAALPGPLPVAVRCATLDLEPTSVRYDTILYIDVLEHIRDDRRELELAAGRLLPGGRVVVLAPAHDWLLSPFDKEIGHFRRYDAASLRAIRGRLSLARCQYLDSAGCLASIANRCLLRRGMPTTGQVRFWDRVLVRISRVADRLLFHRVGKSVLAVYEAPEGGS